MEMVLPLFLIGIVIAIAVMYFFQSAVMNQTSTVSRASRSTELTPGDDFLSLEEDMRRLEADPGETAVMELDAVQ